MPGMHSVMSKPSIPITPVTLPPVLWYDASDATTITASGTAVTKWSSKGTFYPSYSALYNGGGPGRNPLLTGINSLNGKNVLTCDVDLANTEAFYSPSDFYLFDTSVSLGPLLGNVSHSIFLVIRGNNVTPFSQTSYPLFVGNLFDPEVSYGWRELHTTPTVTGYTYNTFQSIDPTTPGGAQTTNGAVVTTSFTIISYVYDGTTAAVYRSGVLIDTQEVNGTNTTASGRWGISTFTGGIAEMIVYDKTSSSIRTGIENYLKTKWGL